MENLTLSDIFKNRIFRIPDYQRGYAWQSRQLEDFWEDLVNLSDRKHYMGLLSLKSLKKEEKVWETWKNKSHKDYNEVHWLIEEGFEPFHIVDGQQRLTTFVIFIQAMIEQVVAIPENKNKKDNEIYLGKFNLSTIKEDYLKREKGAITAYKFGYETDNPSFEFLRHKILGEPGGAVEETLYTHNLQKAKAFFKKNLQNFYEKKGIDAIASLFEKATQNLMFNMYEISDDFNVFISFETMNNRGKELSHLELLKNRLIYLTTLYDSKELPNDEKTILREKINKAWKEVYHQLGRNSEKPLDDDKFLEAHWIIYFLYKRSKQSENAKQFLLDKKFTPKNIYEATALKDETPILEEAYNEEEDNEEDMDTMKAKETAPSKEWLTPKDIEDYVISLEETAVHWYNIHYPQAASTLGEEEKIWLDKLNRYEVLPSPYLRYFFE